MYSVFVYHSTNVESVLPVFFIRMQTGEVGGVGDRHPGAKSLGQGKGGGGDISF